MIEDTVDLVPIQQLVISLRQLAMGFETADVVVPDEVWQQLVCHAAVILDRVSKSDPISARCGFQVVKQLDHIKRIID